MTAQPRLASHSPAVARSALDLRVSARLHAEWRRLRRQPAAVQRARRWELVPGQLDDLDQVLAAAGFETPPTPAAESILRRLVTIAGRDELAARTVVQRLLPGLLGVARRRHHLRPDAFDELLGAAWIVIRTYSPARNPACLAAALIADADHHAFRKQWRRASRCELASDAVALDQIAPEELLTSDAELAEVLAQALDAGVDLRSIDIVRRLATATTDGVAEQLQISPRTVRSRRQRATSEIRRAVVAA